MRRNHTDRKRFWTWLKALGAFIVAITSVAASVVAVQQYRESKAAIDLTGWWKIDFTVETTTHKPYQGILYSYKVYFHQKDEDITGTGEKWWENGVELPYSQHVQIALLGSVRKRNVDLSYTLKGAQRETLGGTRLVADGSGRRMSGRFKGTAADAEGVVIATRMKYE